MSSWASELVEFNGLFRGLTPISFFCLGLRASQDKTRVVLGLGNLGLKDLVRWPLHHILKSKKTGTTPEANRAIWSVGDATYIACVDRFIIVSPKCL